MWDVLPNEIQEYILSLAVWQEIRQRRILFGPLHKEMFDYVTLKNIWRRSGIRVATRPAYQWNLSPWKLTLGKYCHNASAPPTKKDDLFIYGYYWSRTKKDKVLLGLNYQEAIERVLRYYS